MVRGIRLEPWVIQAPVSDPVLPGRPPARRNVARAERGSGGGRTVLEAPPSSHTGLL